MMSIFVLDYTPLRKGNQPKAAIEEVEKRAIERGDQWKKHLAETRVEMERRIEDQD